MPCVKDMTEVAVKLISAIGGFMGGTSILLYMPARDWIDALKRVGVSVIAATMLSVPIAGKLFDSVNNENLMGTAFIVGFAAWFLLGALAKFFENRQGQDLLQITKDVKDGTPTNS